MEHPVYFISNYVNMGIWDPNQVSIAVQKAGELAHAVLTGTPVHYRLLKAAWCIYFFLSGITLTFSRNQYKKCLGLLVLFAVSYITYAFTNKNTDYFIMLEFGMFLGYCVYTFFFQLIRKFPLWFHISLACALFVVLIFSQINNFNFELNPLRWFGISKKLSMSNYDSWNIFPSIFFFAAGGVVGRTVYKNRKSLLPTLDKYLIFKPITWFGRHSLQIYIGLNILLPIIFISLTPIINASI
jgi:uncharacterized membrane protein